MRQLLIDVRDGWAARRWRLRFAVWAVLVALGALLPYDGAATGPAYLLGITVVCVVVAVADARPLMTAGFGLLLASIARLLLLDPAFSPYADGASDPWVAVELLALPLAVLPPLVVTWAIVTRRGKDQLAWVRLPGDGVAAEG